jgi:hypothetical protein
MLNIEYGRWCEQNEVFDCKVTGSNGNVYNVHYNSRDGWSCSCPGYKWSPGNKFDGRKVECKHIPQAVLAKCNHGWELAAGSPVDDFVGDDHLCPECGGPSTVAKYAV